MQALLPQRAGFGDRVDAALTRAQEANDDASDQVSHTPVADLIYELPDAHNDTAQLAEDPLWEAHLDYLRPAQCRERAVLVHMSVDTAT